MKKYILILLLFNLGRISAGTPEYDLARTDLKKAKEAYAKHSNFSMDTYYMVFEEHGPSNMLEGKNGSYIKSKNNTYIKIDDVETIQLIGKTINIMHDEKMIVVGNSPEPTFDPVGIDIDSLLTLCSSIKVENVTTKERKYKLFFNKYELAEYNEIDIILDITNMHYTKVILFYKAAYNLKGDFYAEEKQPRLEIAYKNFKTAINPEIFNETNYITEVNHKVKPVSKYAKYKVVDLRNETRTKK